jgi:hypothetical protein
LIWNIGRKNKSGFINKRYFLPSLILSIANISLNCFELYSIIGSSTDTNKTHL